MAFKPGNKFGKGGARPNPGPKPDEVKLLFQKILTDSNAHKRLKQILTHPENNEMFLKAYALAMDRGFGKVPQPLEHAGEISGRMIIMRAKR